VNNDYLVALCLLPVAAISVSAYAVNYLSAEEVQRILFPDATAFVDNKITLRKPQKAAIKKLAGVRQRWDEQAVWRAEDEKGFAGWVLVDNVVGKHEFITYGVGLSPDGRVIGVEIMAYRETHGGEIRDEEWRNYFKGKTLNDSFKLDKDVPNISGATLSSRNVLDGVKRLLALQEVVLLDEQ
jgi:Na+-translocating ferredoxin:NAD+ oxidoreductase RnfG subunit